MEGRWDLKAAALGERTRRSAEPKLAEFRQALKRGRFEEGYALARTLVEGPFAGEPGYLRLIASAIVGERTDWAVRDVELALEAADRAAGLTDLNDDTVLSALARTYFVNGDLEAAVAPQEAALALTDPPLPVHATALAKYRGALGR